MIQIGLLVFLQTVKKCCAGAFLWAGLMAPPASCDAMCPNSILFVMNSSTCWETDDP